MLSATHQPGQILINYQSNCRPYLQLSEVKSEQVKTNERLDHIGELSESRYRRHLFVFILYILMYLVAGRGSLLVIVLQDPGIIN